MTTFAGPQKLGMALCEALGLDAGKVTGIDVHSHIGEVPTVTVTTLLFVEEAGEFVEVLKRYELRDPDGETVERNRDER